jgi:Reverse transcriptase (RNA-dependent DNA polymerase)
MRRLDGFFNPQAASMYNNLRSRNKEIDDSQKTLLEEEAPVIFPTSEENNIESQKDDNKGIDNDAIIENDNSLDQALALLSIARKDQINNVSTIKEPIDDNPYNAPNAQLKDILHTPSTYEEAFYHQDEWCRMRWRTAITLELNKMNALKVWHPINFSDIPEGRKPIKCKWVFDIKRNGIFRARLVACGYSQIPGIDFEEYYAPVVNDAVFRIVIIIQLLWGLKSVIMDVETAFLHGDLKEDIFMNAPKGTNIPKTNVSN